MQKSILKKIMKDKITSFMQRGTCDVCSNRTHSYCFNCESYLCVHVPTDKAIEKRNLVKEKYISNHDENGKESLFLNTCWLRHHGIGIDCYARGKCVV